MTVSNRRTISIRELGGHRATVKCGEERQPQPGRAAARPEAWGPPVLALLPAEGGPLVTLEVTE